jgi:anaerobic magnesium-protoporphyrin IX monomethyl ester cyclase
MNVTLVFPPCNRELNSSHLPFVERNIGVLPPLSLLYPAATLEEAGHRVSIVDGNAERLGSQQLIQRVRKTKPDLLGFTLSTFTYHRSLEWIRMLKAALGVTVVAGGRHVWYYPRETIERSEVDIAVRAEADHTIVSLAEAIERNTSLQRVEGIMYKRGSRIRQTPLCQPVSNLDSLPFPSRHLLPNDKYYTFISARRNFTTMITVRGCPFHCIFCGVGNSAVRMRSAEKVVAEILRAYELGVRELEVYDDSFTLNRKRALDICARLRKEKLDLDWAIHTRVDLVDRSMLGALSGAGCRRVNYGIESGNKHVLRTLKKGTSLSAVRQAVHATRRVGMDVFGYFVVGAPGETPETVQETMQLSLELPIDYAQFTKIVAHPYTELYDMVLQEKRHDFWQDYIVNGKEAEIPLAGTNLTNKEVDQLVLKAYRKFYFRPGYLLRRLTRLRSAHELVKYCRAAVASIGS